jgi:branched-subunit amino acid transport protein
MDIFTVVLVMTAVTYIPRLVPMMFFRSDMIDPRIKRFLSYIPYAALGALILPGGINAVSGMPFVSITGILIAVVTAWFNRNIIITVAAAVASVYVMLAAGINF